MDTSYSRSCWRIWRSRENGEISEETKNDLIREIGDVLWYISELSRELAFPLEDVAKINMEKLQSRKDRNKLHGEGDNR